MDKSRLTINKATRSQLTRLFLITASFVLTTPVVATNNNSAYVDSVHQWGAWELDIEPAAGGLQPQTSQQLKARDSKVRLRTNSISALAPQRAETITRPPLPVTPPAPAMPPVIPAIGGPADGLF